MNHTETVQQIYQAFSRGDVPAILNALAESIEWEHDGHDSGIPWLKPGRVKAHVAAFFDTIKKQLQIRKFDVQSLVAAPNQIVAVIGLEAIVLPTQKPIRDLELHLWTFDLQGKVAKFRHFVDTHQHWLALQK